MLKHIHIRDLAIVESLELEFDSGMTVFTGETGAGKSILIEGLGLVLGDRADSAVVRAGCGRAEITASFEVDGNDGAERVLEAHGLSAEDGLCILRRQIGGDGRSRGFVNSTPVTMQVLRELGETLVDIHGQHAHQSLLRRDAQRALLDEYANHRQLLEAAAEAAGDWRRTDQALKALQGETGDPQATLDLLRHQVNELETTALGPEALGTLEQEHVRLANMTGLMEGCRQAVDCLDDNEVAARTLVQQALRALEPYAEMDARLQTPVDLIRTAAVNLDEAATGVRRYLDTLELDPQRLAQVETQITAIHDLARKHRTPPADLQTLCGQLQARLDRLEGAEQRLAALEHSRAQALAAWRQAAGALSASRRSHALRLGQAVSANLQRLGMAGGQFAVRIDEERLECPSPEGCDRIEFLVTANPGQPLRPLAKVASGGELSRISLAIQVVNVGGKGVPTLVFDEVDVGIGGAVAEVVGRQLQELAARRQVLCVTHLAQVAAQGRQHLRVWKVSAGDSTQTRIEALGRDQRVEEVARMMGGLKITPETVAHARDMLLRASG